MTANEHFDSLKRDLIGMELSHLWRGHGSAIFLELGQLSSPKPKKNPSGTFTIMIQWSWRIENKNSIICGSWSGDEIWEPSFDLIRGSKVVDLNLFARLPEIEVKLNSGHNVLSFATADGQPEWAILDNRTPESPSLGVENGKLRSGV